MRQDQDLLEESDLEKPEKPVSTFGPEAREKIEQKFQEIRRLPGEPVITPELCNDAGVTPSNQCPRRVRRTSVLVYRFMLKKNDRSAVICRGEQARRNDVGKVNVFIKVLFNNKEVVKTENK